MIPTLFIVVFTTKYSITENPHSCKQKHGFFAHFQGFFILSLSAFFIESHLFLEVHIIEQQTPFRARNPAGCLLFVFMFYSVYFVRELLLRLLYTPVPATPAADTASKANHKARLLLSPVFGLFVVLTLELLSVGSFGSVMDLV